MIPLSSQGLGAALSDRDVESMEVQAVLHYEIKRQSSTSIMFAGPGRRAERQGRGVHKGGAGGVSGAFAAAGAAAARALAALSGALQDNLLDLTVLERVKHSHRECNLCRGSERMRSLLPTLQQLVRSQHFQLPNYKPLCGMSCPSRYSGGSCEEPTPWLGSAAHAVLLPC